MLYWTIQYVDASNTTQEVSFSALAALEGGAVVSDGWTPKFCSHRASQVSLRLPGVPPDRAPAIPFESRITIWSGRTLSGGTYSGGTKQFQGYRTDRTGLADPRRPSCSYVFEDDWYFLEHVPFCQTWNRNTTPLAAPTITTFIYQSVILFMANPGQTYSPAPVYNLITSGQQIVDILNWAISIGANLQIGQIDPGLYTAVYPVQNVKAAEAIRICLRPHPDCYTEIDYTTTPPTFNVRKRANLTSVTLPYAYTDGLGRRHTSSEVQPRPELIPRRVALFYRVISSGYVLTTPSDIYPSAATTGLRSMEYSIDLQGPKATLTTAQITSYAFDPTQLAWWQKKVPSLASSTISSLALLSDNINDGADALSITVTDDNGNPINISAGNYAYELDPKSSVLSWETLPAGGPVQVTRAIVTAHFKYTKAKAVGSGSLNTQSPNDHVHHVRIKLTNTPTATFQFSQYLTTGEAVPPGLAEAIYNSLATLQYSFSHTCVEAPFNGWIKPGKHCINLNGGAAAWETMNATPQEVTYKMHLDGAGNSFDNFTVKCGPVEHLEPGQLVQIYNLFANRDLTKIDTNERLTGNASPASNVAMPSDTAQENSIPAEADDALKVFSAPDTIDATRTIAIKNDPTNGQISFQQLKSADGTTYTSGVIPPLYTGSGSPGSGTLAANASYRIFDTYLDISTPSAPVLWSCKTAGSNSSSAWAKVSGGGGGIGGMNEIAASYTAVAGDNGKLVSIQTTGAATLTLPATPPSSTWLIGVNYIGTGSLTISGAGIPFGTSIGNLQGMFIFTDGTNYYFTAGPPINNYTANAFYYNAGGAKTGAGGSASSGTAFPLNGWILNTCEDDGTGTGNTATYQRIFYCSDRL